MKYIKKELIIMISVMGMSFSSLLIAMTHSQLANKIKKIDVLMDDSKEIINEVLHKLLAQDIKNIDALKKKVQQNKKQIKDLLNQFQAAGLKGYVSKYKLKWESMFFDATVKNVQPIMEEKDAATAKRMSAILKRNMQSIINFIDENKIEEKSKIKSGHQKPVKRKPVKRKPVTGKPVKKIGECGDGMIKAFTDHLDLLLGKEKYKGYEDKLANLSSSNTFLEDVESCVEDIGKIISQIYYKDYPPRSSEYDALLKGDWIKVLQKKDPEGKEVVLAPVDFSSGKGYQLKRYQEYVWSKKQRDIYHDKSPKQQQAEEEEIEPLTISDTEEQEHLGSADE